MPRRHAKSVALVTATLVSWAGLASGPSLAGPAGKRIEHRLVAAKAPPVRSSSATPSTPSKPGKSSTRNTSDKKKTKRKPQPFRWVNPLTPGMLNLNLPVKHHTFKSSSMGIDVGYCIYLPPAYNKKESEAKRYPVVYYLHGGRPGRETKSIQLSAYVDKAVRRGDIPPAIYVFINGGPVSHYNYPQIKHGMGEDVFIRELIPHIDKTYRTVAKRLGRAIEGFSQGGRGTTRIMFKHPHLFCSASPGGAGHATEKRISEEGGRESANLVFAKGYNTYDLARAYARKHSHDKAQAPPLRMQIHVGTKGFNYENNLAYMKFLDTLKIPYERLIVEGAPHSAKLIYDKQGLAIMKFHAANFAAASNAEK